MDRNRQALLRLLPVPLRLVAAAALERHPDAEELRLRAGRQPGLTTGKGEISFAGEALTPEDLRRILEAATGASMHCARTQLCQGFLTVQGGFRIGLCGSVQEENGTIRGIYGIHALSIRLPRAVTGCADGICAAVQGASTLILSPPGGGKTTLLRDLIRQISDGGRRVALADERGEVAAVWNGAAQFDVGRCTDIMTGGRKGETALMLLRAMNPEVLAMDEITSPADVAACCTVSHCGVQILATAHSGSIEDLSGRPVYRELMERHIFEKAVFIRKSGAGRTYEVVPL